jgi:SAM-dependent methyltransferase
MFKKALKKLNAKQAFAPDAMGIILNPFYFARKGLYKNIKNLSNHINGKILDVGCGRKPYKNLFSFSEYIGIDIENPGHSHEEEDIDIYYDGTTFPFPDSQFDNALCNQVLEHVFHPDKFLKEIHRVLKDEGHLLLTVPFVWDEHEQPNDYARYSSFGLRFLLEKNGFVIVHHCKSVNNITAIFQMLNAYVHKKLMTKGRLPYYLALILFIFPINLIGTVANFLLPINNDLFLDNVVLARRAA